MKTETRTQKKDKLQVGTVEIKKNDKNILKIEFQIL